MHAAAFRALGLPHTYEAIRAGAEDVPRFVAELRAGGFAGLNITVPHKRLALSLADEVDPSAQRSGSCNVLSTRDGRVVAFDTDAAALAAEIEALGPARRDRALVLGAGGAARCAVVALAGLGFAEVAVRARRAAEAIAIASEQGAGTCVVLAETWGPIPSYEERTAIVVQATSAGMTGGESGGDVVQAVALAWLPPDTVAIDLVYAPPETLFLRAARAHGMRAVGGLGMLARQGARALELWLGRPAPLEAMRAAL
jgi:shikimate dehydrogenase